MCKTILLRVLAFMQLLASGSLVLFTLWVSFVYWAVANPCVFYTKVPICQSVFTFGTAEQRTLGHLKV
jgi:hypothetical protein